MIWLFIAALFVAATLGFVTCAILMAGSKATEQEKLEEAARVRAFEEELRRGKSYPEDWDRSSAHPGGGYPI